MPRMCRRATDPERVEGCACESAGERRIGVVGEPRDQQLLDGQRARRRVYALQKWLPRFSRSASSYRSIHLSRCLSEVNARVRVTPR
jgi:hypothetical protein